MDNPIIQKLKLQFADRKVLIVGLGLQGGGVGLVRFFSELGAKVTATDLKGENQLTQSIKALESYKVIYHLNGHQKNDFLTTDYIFKGPSVPWDLPELIAAEHKKIPIEMESSFFTSLCPASVIGITGTRGKTTTASMIYESLKYTTDGVYLAGNVSGTSTIELLYKVKKGDLVILELSSWQLSGFHRRKISPHIAVFTNLYPDHLNYYQTEDKYFFDKKAIFAYQQKKDYLIANSQLINKLQSLNIRSTVRYFSSRDFSTTLTYLRGEHNQENAAAALLVNETLGQDVEETTRKICAFKGIPFRQEITRKKGNVIFVNDSTSTAPVSVSKALDTFTDGKIVLILGGNSKRLSFEDLISKLTRADYIVLLKGSFTDEIINILVEKFKTKITQPYDNLNTAIKMAYKIASSFQQKTYVLFSPGATSFSMFNNEFERGKQFNEIVDSL